MTCYFAEKYLERFFNAGIGEANMVGVGAGLATTGKTVFVNSFAMFSTGRAYDQVRNSVCYPHLNVKIVGTHAGLSVGEDGATHQCIEDISLMRTIPGMTVIVPCDVYEAAAATRAISDHEGPCYLRLGRSPVPDVTRDIKDYSFKIGKAVIMNDGTDCTIIATGLMVAKALEAAHHLAETQGLNIRVLDVHTIKPLDKEAIFTAARETGAIITAEEHNIIGGLGSAISEVISENMPSIPVLKVGVNDVFGHSGSTEECLEHYGLTAGYIEELVAKAVMLKNK
ncbi:transketolase family protein [Alloscardovia venturai]|uniref:Transketolase family protein n=2 Tax=Alloscardovia venturai TaxID=1769421 RepID=A0ABW2Y5N8_9BIFI